MTKDLTNSMDTWEQTLENFSAHDDLKPLSRFDDEQDKNAQTFFGYGKLLLSGEYFVLDGAQSLALPTRVGQSLTVKYSPSFNPTLTWKSFDVRGRLWLETRFEFWHFDFIDEETSPEAKMLQKILRQVRKQNKHFLRDNVDVYVETHLGFPLDWGLGSSSTLIYNIAQWAYVSPFELQFETYGGSGYDIACAQSGGPILYQKEEQTPHWSPIIFEPDFSDQLYFVYLGKKQNSRKAIEYYNQLRPFPDHIVEKVSQITKQLVQNNTLEDFEALITEHEQLVSSALGLDCIKSKLFPDYWGAVKSLGAWGGDFVLVSSSRSQEETEKYFRDKGHSVILPYRKLILEGVTPPLSPSQEGPENGYLH